METTHKPVIAVEGIGKCYQLGTSRHDSARDQIAHAVRSLASKLPGMRSNGEEAASAPGSFWALRNVSFTVEQGDVVGIIGPNGAGKSTLLKVLSQITEPTEGEVRIRGRLASLLEVGTGFHPELTGRENVFLNGAILGMTKKEIRKRFDEIVAFAEVEKFLDTPVKRYSSGMYVRLAFAVAAHLEPEVLVVDEVLAVGDAAFQKKCLGKMREVGNSGRTVIFVSHNMGTVSNLCSRGIVVRGGGIDFDGKVEEAVQRYARIVARTDETERESHVIYQIPKDDQADFAITSISLHDLDGTPKPVTMSWDPVVMRFEYRCARAVQRGSVVVQAASFDGSKLFTISTQPDGTFPLAFEAGTGVVECVVPRLPMAAGEYLLGAGLAVPWSEYLCWNQDLCWLNIFPRDVYESGLAPALPRSMLAFEHSWRLGKPEAKI